MMLLLVTQDSKVSAASKFLNEVMGVASVGVQLLNQNTLWMTCRDKHQLR